MKTLYFDCFSGISGDMTVAALIDLGCDLDYLRSELRKLPLKDFELHLSRVERASISAAKFDVRFEEVPDSGHTHRNAFEIIEPDVIPSQSMWVVTRIFFLDFTASEI